MNWIWIPWLLWGIRWGCISVIIGEIGSEVEFNIGSEVRVKWFRMEVTSYNMARRLFTAKTLPAQCGMLGRSYNCALSSWGSLALQNAFLQSPCCWRMCLTAAVLAKQEGAGSHIFQNCKTHLLYMFFVVCCERTSQSQSVNGHLSGVWTAMWMCVTTQLYGQDLVRSSHPCMHSMAVAVYNISDAN